MNYPVLYKRTETGAAQVWFQTINGAFWRTTSGQKEGQKVESTWHECFMTNPGKKNQRTPEEQSIFEVEANYKKKLETGYFKNEAEIDNEFFFEPMLARNFDDLKGKIDFKREVYYTQPKLDGIRCIATPKGLFSRNGKALVSTPHIIEELIATGIFDKVQVIDGELYSHKLRDNFNEIISLARKTKPTKEDLILSRQTIEYHVYDCCPVDKLNFFDRFNILENYLDGSPLDKIRLVQTSQVTSLEQIDNFNSLYVRDGYEGQMIRFNGPYENKRSKYLLKRKEFLEEELTVVDIQEGIGNRAGMAGTIFVRLQDGRTCGSGIKGTHEYCKELLLNKAEYIGGQTTVRYFERTPDNIPRFPVSIAMWKGKRDL